MAQGMLLACSLLCLAASAKAAVTLTSIAPAKFSVNVSYVIDGQNVTVSPPCTEQAPGAQCLPKPHALRDSVVVTYALLPQYSPNTSDSAQVKICYSSFSQVNRPWRKPNNVISLSKACPWSVKTGLNSTAGTAVWKIPQNASIATYNARVYVLRKNASNPTSSYQVAYGTSSGFFQVVPITTREHGLVIAAGICICVGPIMFAALMIYEFKFKSKKVV